MYSLGRFSIALALVCSIGSVHAWGEDWPQWRGPSRDGVWTESGIVEKFPSSKLEAVWRAPIHAGYSGPTVADGRVYVSDRLVEGREQKERVLCFDEKTGKEIWKLEYDCTYTISYEAGPRACITVNGGRAYALGAMGHMHCLDAASGDVIWKRDLGEDLEIQMPIWGISAAPLIYKDLAILQIGGKGACVAALDCQTGKTAWTALDDRASYSAPVLAKQAGEDVVVVWTGDSVSGLAPLNGQVHWRIPFPPSRMPIGIATPVLHDNQLYVTSFYDGSLMLKLSSDSATATKVWQERGPSERDTRALHSIISTPIRLGDYIYGVDSYGELRCLEASTGKRIWEDLSAVPKIRWGTIHFVQNGERTFMFNDRGELLIGQLSPGGFKEIDRTKLIDPTKAQLNRRDGVCWSHPAYANKHIFVRNDKEIACFSLAKPQP